MRSGLVVVGLVKSCEQLGLLSTEIKKILNTVHNFIGLCAVFTSFVQSFIHGLFAIFQSVVSDLIPALHSTNNKNKFKINYLATIEGVSL